MSPFLNTLFNIAAPVVIPAVKNIIEEISDVDFSAPRNNHKPTVVQEVVQEPKIEYDVEPKDLDNRSDIMNCSDEYLGNIKEQPNINITVNVNIYNAPMTINKRRIDEFDDIWDLV